VESIRSHGKKAVIGGDVGASAEDNRGRKVMDWIAQNHLVIHNKGNQPTFKRGDRREPQRKLNGKDNERDGHITQNGRKALRKNIEEEKGQNGEEVCAEKRQRTITKACDVVYKKRKNNDQCGGGVRMWPRQEGFS
jgi:hypothetical protein